MLQVSLYIHCFPPIFMTLYLHLQLFQASRSHYSSLKANYHILNLTQSTKSANYLNVFLGFILPGAELLDTVEASMRIITGNVRHAKGEYLPFIFFL